MIKVLFDIRGTQRWRERGIPRYIQNLAFSIKENFPEIEFTFLYERGLSGGIWHDELLKSGSILFDDDDLSGLSFDVFLMGWVFLPPTTGRSLIEYLIPPTLSKKNVKKTVAIAYDFIPWRFPEDYLSNTRLKKQYLETLDLLSNIDLILTISDDVSRDAERLFPAQRKSGRIANINGGIGTFLGRVPKANSELAENLLKAYGLEPKRYWIYIGGDDPRKNLDQLVQSIEFKKSPYPVVVVCKISADRQVYLLSKVPSDFRDRLIFTGFLPDEELWTLLRSAFASVFVSKYEGLGLPILESYCVETPVICSNNSSLKDLAPPSHLIESPTAREIAAKMDWAEKSANFKSISLDYWNSIRDKYCWSFSAKASVTAIKALMQMNLEPSIKAHRSKDRSDRFWYSILPPAKSGIADHDQQLFENSKQSNFPVPYFVPMNIFEIDTEQFNFNIIDRRDVESVAREVSYRVFTFGNSVHHLETVKEFSKFTRHHPNVSVFVYLHEVMLNGMWCCYFGSFESYKAYLQLCYGGFRKIDFTRVTSLEELVQHDVYGVLPLLKSVKISKIFVNSLFAKNLLLRDLGDYQVEIEVMFLPALSVAPSNLVENVESRKIRIGCFGIAGANKSPHLVIEACELLRKRGFDIELYFAGYSLDYLDRKLSEQNWITKIENPNNEKLYKIIEKVHLAVQLRPVTFGEASGMVTHLLALNKLVVVTDLGWFSELGEAVERVHVNVNGSELADAILKSIDRAKFRKQKAAEWVSERLPSRFWEKFDAALKK